MNTLTSLICQYGLSASLILIFLEYACFPISSEVLLPLTGAVCAMNHVPYFQILPLSVLAALAGTSVCYVAGRVGGSFLTDRITRFFPKSKRPLTFSFRCFERYGSLAVSISRLIPLCRTYIAFVAGTLKLDYPSYLIASFFGVCLWNALLVGLGYTLGENWSVVANYYQRYKEVLLFLLCALPLLTLAFLRLKKNLDIFHF